MSDIIAICQILIQVASPWMNAELNSLTRVQRDIVNIMEDFKSITAFLKDVDDIDPERDMWIKEWVRQVRTLAHGMEDAIENYKLSQTVDNLFNKLNLKHVLDKRHIASDIKSLQENAANIRMRKEAYSLHRTQVTLLSGCVCMNEENELVGAEAAKQELIELIALQELQDSRLSTIAVTGMTGVGKTALVRSVYNHEMVRDYFPIRAWVHVPYNCVDLQLQRNILKQFHEAASLLHRLNYPLNDTDDRESRPTPDQIDSMDKESLQNHFKKLFQDKRFLVVFDDVQDHNWDTQLDREREAELASAENVLKSINSKDGSKIVITTRSENVARNWVDNGSDNGVFKLHPLPMEESWKLFCNKAFRNSVSGTCPSNLERLARKIVTRCEGLPLLISKIGRFLSTKLDDSRDWEKMSESLGFFLEQERTGIYNHFIRSCYHCLPHDLRPCFLYFGLFHKGNPVSRMKLIRLWIAEGFIINKEGSSRAGEKTLEEKAEEYIKQLVDMNLVEEIKDSASAAATKNLRVSEFLHEIILLKVKEVCFFQVLEKNTISIDEFVKPRRLSIHIDNDEDQQNSSLHDRDHDHDHQVVPSLVKSQSKVRSLLLVKKPAVREEQDSCPAREERSPARHPFWKKKADKEKKEPWSESLTKELLESYKIVYLLKVLDLCDAPIEDLSDEVVKNLPNLRYLSLRKTRVRELPSSIGKLQELQTLDLKQTLIQELPREINELQKLRHLLMYRYEFDVGYSLHAMKMTGVKLPKGALDKNKELQKLAFLDVAVSPGHSTSMGVKELRNLMFLRRLGIVGLKLEDGIHVCVALENMKFLEALSVYSKTKTDRIDLEHFNSRPPLKRLKRLYLNGPLLSFPGWIFELSSLVKLRLRWSDLPNSEPLDKLHVLPNLVELQLLEAYNGEFLEFRDEGFRKLQILHLLDLHHLENLLINEGALPFLEELSIGASPNLQMPSGIQYLSSLKTLTFINMPRDFTENIRPGKQYHSAVQHVPCVSLRYFNYNQGCWDTYTL